MTREDQFKTELFALLRKYRVEMTVRERTRHHDTVCEGVTFYSPTLWSKDIAMGEPLEESFELDLGCWEDGHRD